MIEYLTLFNAIFVLINFYVLSKIIRWIRGNAHLIGMAKAWASQMGTKGNESRRTTAQYKDALASQNKAIKNVFNKVPMLKAGLELTGLKEQELYNWFVDPVLGKNLLYLIETGSKLLGGLGEWIEKGSEQLGNLNKPKKEEYRLLGK